MPQTPLEGPISPTNSNTAPPPMIHDGILLAAQANAGDSRRDQGTSDLDLQ